MAKYRIKPEMIGVKTSSKIIAGQIKVSAEHVDMFVREQRWDLVETIESKPLKELTSGTKPKRKRDLSKSE